MSLENKLNNNDTRLKPTVRTNSTNIPGGTYNIPKASNIHGTNNYNSGVLKNLKGDTIKQILSPYDEKNTYLTQYIGTPKEKTKNILRRKQPIPPQTQVDDMINKTISGNIPSSFSSEQLKDNLQSPK